MRSVFVSSSGGIIVVKILILLLVQYSIVYLGKLRYPFRCSKWQGQAECTYRPPG